MDKTYTENDARIEQEHAEEVTVTPEFVTISRRVPTRTYYEQKVAPQTERRLIESLNEELSQFLALISYRVDQSHWNPDGTTHERPFELRPVQGATEPFPKELPAEVWEMDAETRQGRPLFSVLCDAWLNMTPAMREAYDAIIAAERTYHVLDKQAWNIVRDDKLDLGSYSKTTEERDEAAHAIDDAKDRYMETVRGSLVVISAIAKEHLDEAHRYAWGDLGFDEWLRENSADAPLA